jgi:hypothetical protein
MGKLNVLTFPVFGIAHPLDNLTDLSLAAVHRLANNLATATFLQHLDNFISLGLCLPHRVALYSRRFTPAQG